MNRRNFLKLTSSFLVLFPFTPNIFQQEDAVITPSDEKTYIGVDKASSKGDYTTLNRYNQSILTFDEPLSDYEFWLAKNCFLKLNCKCRLEWIEIE